MATAPVARGPGRIWRAWCAARRRVRQDASLVGLSVAATTLVVFWIAKLASAGIALAAGFASQLTWWHLPAALGVLAEDLLAAAGVGIATWALAALAARRLRLGWLRLAIGQAVLLPVVLLTVLGVGLYRLYQTPLTWGLLGLMGTVTDYTTSIRTNLTGLNVVLLVGLPLGAALSLAPLGAWVAERAEAWAGRRPRAWVWPALLAATAVSYLLLPGRSFAGLELNAVVELVRSGLSASGPGASVAHTDLGEAPVFGLERVFDPSDPAVEDLSGLVDLGQRPAGAMNLLLIAGESWAASQHCLLDGPADACPRLRELVPHTLVFEDYHCITPVSMKSLFSLTCSVHPVPIPQAITYVHGNIDCRSVSEVLKERGYATALFHGGHFHYSDKLRYFDHRRYDVMRDGDSLKARKRYPVNGWGADDRAVRDDFLQWIERVEPGKPWHALLIPITPHYPYQPIPRTPEPYGRATLRDKYLNQMVLQDTIIGDIWDALGRRGEQERTLIVLVGDHGQAFEEHPGNKMHGSYIYQESVRVPLVLINPLLFRGGRSKRLGNHLDLVPTILDTLGLPRVDRHEGQSLLSGYEPRRVHFYTRYAHYQLGLRDGRFKYIHDKDRDTHELYDLLADPGERSNIASSHTAQVQRYSALTDSWERFYQELIPNYERYRLGPGPCKGKPVCFLDELEPTFRHGNARAKRSALGRGMRISGRAFGRGWGVEAPSILRFSVSGLGYRWLRGTVGHDDDIFAGQLGETVSGQIYVDGKLALATGKMKKGAEPVEFRIPVEGARQVELFGHDMDGIGYRDHIDWADVRLTMD